MSGPPGQNGIQDSDHNPAVHVQQQSSTLVCSSTTLPDFSSTFTPTTAAPSTSIPPSDPSDAKSPSSSPLDLLSHVALDLPLINSQDSIDIPTALIPPMATNALLPRFPPPCQLADAAQQPQPQSLPYASAPLSQLSNDNSPAVLPRLPPLSMLPSVQPPDFKGMKRSFDHFNFTDRSTNIAIPDLSTEFHFDSIPKLGNGDVRFNNHDDNYTADPNTSDNHRYDDGNRMRQIRVAVARGEHNADQSCYNDDNNIQQLQHHLPEQKYTNLNPTPCSPSSAKRTTFLHSPHVTTFQQRMLPGCGSSACTNMACQAHLTLANGAGCSTSMGMTNLSPVSSHEHSRSPSRSTMERPNKMMRCTNTGSGHRSPSRCHSPITPTSSTHAHHVTVSAPIVKTRSQPSRFCHVCSRTSKKVGLVACANFSSGACRKVICQKCFNDHCWDWKFAVENNSQWLCPHCRGCCPQRAQCSIYRRTNERRREQQLMQRGWRVGDGTDSLGKAMEREEHLHSQEVVRGLGSLNPLNHIRGDGMS